MATVPKNKRVYVGARKFVEGEALPPFVILEQNKVLTKTEVTKMAEDHEKTRKRRMTRMP
jgi:hypothetical protein